MEMYFLVTRFLFRLNIHVEYKDTHLVFARSFSENQHFLLPWYGMHKYAIQIFPASNPFQQYNDLVDMSTLKL